MRLMSEAKTYGEVLIVFKCLISVAIVAENMY